MCLAVPARIVSLDSAASLAMVDLDGIRKEISTLLLDDVAVDDYVLVHVGFALQCINPLEAEKTLRLFDELKDMEP